MNRSLARDSVAADLPDGVRLAAKKSNLRPFYNQTLSGPDLAPIRLLLEPPDARIYEYVDRGRMLELLHRPLSVGQSRMGGLDHSDLGGHDRRDSASVARGRRVLPGLHRCRTTPRPEPTRSFAERTGSPCASAFFQPCRASRSRYIDQSAKRRHELGS